MGCNVSAKALLEVFNLCASGDLDLNISDLRVFLAVLEGEADQLSTTASDRANAYVALRCRLDMTTSTFSRSIIKLGTDSFDRKRCLGLVDYRHLNGREKVAYTTPKGREFAETLIMTLEGRPRPGGYVPTPPAARSPWASAPA